MDQDQRLLVVRDMLRAAHRMLLFLPEQEAAHDAVGDALDVIEAATDDRR